MADPQNIDSTKNPQQDQTKPTPRPLDQNQPNQPKTEEEINRENQRRSA